MAADKETEITPAMTFAGVEALFMFDMRSDDPEWIVGTIYEAMRRETTSHSGSVGHPRLLSSHMTGKSVPSVEPRPFKDDGGNVQASIANEP